MKFIRKYYSYIIFFLVVFVLYITIYSSFRWSSIESFENKTLYLVWRSGSASNGFGDKIRAVIATNQYCKKNNIRFVVDGTDDICAYFLKNIRSKKEDYDNIKDKEILVIGCDNINWNSDCNFEKRIEEEFVDKDNILIYTNKCPDGDDCVSYNPTILSEEDKEFAKHICEPTDDIKMEVDQTIKMLPKDYGILHFRFLDDIFSKDLDENDPIFIQFFNILKDNYSSTDILMSNSTNFKNYAKRNLEIKTIDCDGSECKVEHIGNSNDRESVKNSFIEFYIITNAKYIKTKSHYGWVSNFVKWPALIYDIPLQELNA
jgi:hypothetical protein